MAEKASKLNFFSRIGKFFRDQKGETKKIVWPSKKQVVNNTIIVIIAIVLFAVIVGVFDWLFGLLIKLLIG